MFITGVLVTLSVLCAFFAGWLLIAQIADSNGKMNLKDPAAWIMVGVFFICTFYLGAMMERHIISDQPVATKKPN